MPILLAFDFDGVVINSIDPLKRVYFDFLAQFSIRGSETEFEDLNGPSIKEIVSILKDRHCIEAFYDDLLENYQNRLNRAYIDAPLINDIKETLANLNDRGLDLALVTSSQRSEVETILIKHKLDIFFKFIVTGDDVKKSKPSPEIYLAVKEKFKQHDVWAIEDSSNGIRSANRAGLKVIYFDQFDRGTQLKVDCRIKKIRQLPMIIQGIEEDYCLVEDSEKIIIEIKDNFFPKIKNEFNILVERSWKKALASGTLHDSEVLYYLDHSTTASGVKVRAFWASYKYFHTSLHHPSSVFNFIPLAISGVCINSGGLFLTGIRRNVTEYKAREELVPSGGISPSAKVGKNLDHRKQLVEELFEETCIHQKSIKLLTDIGIIRDLRNGVMDICCRIDLDNENDLIRSSTDEYEKLSWKDISDICLKQLVPTSLGIVSLLTNLRKADD